MKDKRLQYLLKRYRRNVHSEEELEELNSWYHSLHFEDESFDSWVADKDEFYADFKNRLKPESRQGLFGGIGEIAKDRISPLSWRLAAVAALVLMFSTTIYLIKLNQNDGKEQQLIKQDPNDIAPGGNNAFLTLADGRRIDLNKAEDGELANQSGIKVTKTADGQLIYTVVNANESSPANAYNTIETPYGGQYQVNLPDGTKVWLNSASSIRYPIRFSGGERRVEISGEAYFEVAHDRDKPFRVDNAHQTIEVLGTHFNVMSYSDEATVSTTLLEGAVKISSDNKSKTLVPGQQARTSPQNIDVVEVDTEEVIAWKNGYFIFKSEDVQSIMRQISRWYNVSIEYRGDIHGKVFGGRISRSRNVSEVLAILESTGSLKFKIINDENPENERRIIVMP